MRFAADGSHVLIDYPNDDSSAERTADLVRGAGGTATLIKVGIETPDGVATLVETSGAHAERIDQVVHGAVLPVSSTVHSDVRPRTPRAARTDRRRSLPRARRRLSSG